MLRPPLDTFQIGWICALWIEAAAAAAMLDEPFGILDEQDAADTNTYTLGRIGKHHVVIACLPGGQYGTTSATTVANNMMRTFSKSLRIGLMVGIGGGIPSADHDIRLGDVVISYPQGTCGGVIQYDMGKVVAGGEFERTGSLNSPPRALLTAVSVLRAAELRDKPRYLEYLQNAIGRTAQTQRNFGRPATQYDRLFQAKYNHPANASSCDRCPAEWEETRSEREDSYPQPHYGIIASGNSVVKYGQIRERLKSNTGVLCFEMEVAGLMLDFPCIVVRGVCDYADSHKNKQWQGYAALVAASYTKELLEYVPVGRISQEKLVVDVCNELKEEIRGTNQRLNEIKSQQDQHYREQMEMALKGPSYEDQKNINPRRAEGTCLWALQSPEYIRWSESTSHDLLWVSADPGCGKSVLARAIIDDYLEPSQAVTVCYFFFKDNEEQNHLAGAMCLILHQLFDQRPDLLRYAILSWEKNGKKLRQEVEELWRIFVTAASAETSRKSICIFDALDECRDSDRDRLIDRLHSFYRQSSSPAKDGCLKFLVTSRPYDNIQNHFRAITNPFPHLHLKGEEDNDQIHKEIDIVVRKRVKELAETAQLSPDVTQRLERQLLNMEHRTYLWLYLAMDDIRSTFEDSLQPAEESIPTIPSSVNEAYERMLNRVPPGREGTLREVLQIIVVASRPWTMVEMAKALDIALPPHNRGEKLDPCNLEKKLRRWSGLFIFVNRSKIYLIHQTAKEFLEAKEGLRQQESTKWRQSVNFRYAHQALAQICMTYLHETMFKENDSHLSKVGEDRGKRDGLLVYSATHWISHLESGSKPEEKEFIRLAGSLCDETRASMWSCFVEPPSRYYRDVNEPLPFFWAARWGLRDVADLILQDRQIRITHEIIEKAAAHTSGDGTVMKLLLDRRGDEIKVTDKAMQKAAANSSCGLSIMRLLLDRKGPEIKVTSTTMEKAAMNWNQGAEMINYLLDQKGCEMILPRFISAALTNPAQGEEIIYILRSRTYASRSVPQVLRIQQRNRDRRRKERRKAVYIKSCRRQRLREPGK